MIKAPKPATLVATEIQTRPPMQTCVLNKTNLAIRVSERDQFFAEQLYPHGVAVGMRQL